MATDAEREFEAAALAELERMKRQWAEEDRRSRRRLFKTLAITVPLTVVSFIVGGGL